jgi:DMSO reductase anchor subunit
MLPADYYSVSPEHGHPPLVVMLGLTQLSVGAFIVNLLAHLIFNMGGASVRALDVSNALCSLALGMVALGASTLHLGRPQFAFRAFLGLRTSWLSREIIAFSLFAGLSAAFASSFFAPAALARLRPALGVSAAAAGALGVFCSVMVYAATRRSHWRGSATGFKFALTTLVLGAAAVSAISLASSAARASGGGGPPPCPPPFLATGAYRWLAVILMLAAGLKLAVEASIFRHLRDRRHSIEKRLALLMKGELGRTSAARFLCGVLGGLVLPALGLGIAALAERSARPLPLAPLTVIAGAALVLSLAGELLERYLFFAAAPASRMPGGIA